VEKLRAQKIKNPSSEYRENNVKHGEFGTRLYGIWAHMKARCLNINCPDYSSYGARGISVCISWMDYRNFAIWARTNGYSDELTIDRINNNRNYEPSNCRWATPKAQANNTRNNRLIEYKGITMTLQQWADKTGIRRETIAYRINSGWDIDRALTERVS